jgi:hypothetical protein
MVFSAETLQGKRDWDDIFKVLKQNKRTARQEYTLQNELQR